MKNYGKRVEDTLLMLLWALTLPTFSIALLNHYFLSTSDFIGILGLLIVSLIFWKLPSLKTHSLFIFLLLGTFNLATFVYFFNLTMAPGLQVLSLTCLAILILKRRSVFIHWYKKATGTTSIEKKESFEKLKKHFKEKFENLDLMELEIKLNQDLQPEARQAVIEIITDKDSSNKTKQDHPA